MSDTPLAEALLKEWSTWLDPEFIETEGDRLRSLERDSRAAAEKDVRTLDAAIAKAPHSKWCATNDSRRVYKVTPCTCWKADYDAAKEGRSWNEKERSNAKNYELQNPDAFGEVVDREADWRDTFERNQADE